LAAAVLAAAGCAGQTTPSRFYTLSPAAEGTAYRPSPSVTSVGVGPVRLPETLDRPQIVTRSGANQLEVSDFHRWGGDLREEVPGVIAENLTRLLSPVPVVVMPFAGMAAPSHRVVVDVRRFDGVPGESVVLIAGWSVVPAAGGAGEDLRRSRIEEPVRLPGIDGYVDAQSRALGALSREIAQALAAGP
jgi:uncharacterized lipoprotein YmbA